MDGDGDQRDQGKHAITVCITSISQCHSVVFELSEKKFRHISLGLPVTFLAACLSPVTPLPVLSTRILRWTAAWLNVVLITPRLRLLLPFVPVL